MLCPGVVRTNIGTSSRCRTARLAGGGLKDVDISREENPLYRWISPAETGAVVVRAIKRGDLYVLTHPDWYPMVEQRHQAWPPPSGRRPRTKGQAVADLSCTLRDRTQRIDTERTSWTLCGTASAMPGTRH